MKIVSHTLCKNSRPFLVPIINRVIPYVDECLITVSTDSTDGTISDIAGLNSAYPEKIRILIEHDLYKERQRQVDLTNADWVLFLDDDDWWTEDGLKEVMWNLDDKTDAFCVQPYQLYDDYTYDWNFSYKNKKFFTKWFRMQKGLEWRGQFPLDNLYLNGKMLYWKTGGNVKRLQTRYFHLSYIKNYSFRNDHPFHAHKFGKKVALPEDMRKEARKILSYVNHN